MMMVPRTRLLIIQTIRGSHQRMYQPQKPQQNMTLTIQMENKKMVDKENIVGLLLDGWA